MANRIKLQDNIYTYLCFNIFFCDIDRLLGLNMQHDAATISIYKRMQKSEPQIESQKHTTFLIFI